MPRPTRGSIYTVKGGVGIRWTENGRRPSKAPFRNATAAHAWFDENVAPRLRRRGPTPDADITFADFADLYFEQWGADVTDRTQTTLRNWLAPALTRFGNWRLAELEGAAVDIARWRARLPTDHGRYTATRALRQVLEAAKRWRYIARNPAVEAGPNPQPRGDEVWPFTRDQVDGIADELADRDAAIVIFAAETGLRTNEWTALERRDIDRHNPAVAVARRYSEGTLTPYPKTKRRRVPLTPRAVAALDLLAPRLDTTILFAGDKGGPVNLNNWRNRIWYPALQAAGIDQRGPYCLRHTFATEALAAGISIFQLSRLMGASVETIEAHYGHLSHESEEHFRALLAERSGIIVATDNMPEP